MDYVAKTAKSLAGVAAMLGDDELRSLVSEENFKHACGMFEEGKNALHMPAHEFAKFVTTEDFTQQLSDWVRENLGGGKLCDHSKAPKDLSLASSVITQIYGAVYFEEESNYVMNPYYNFIHKDCDWNQPGFYDGVIAARGPTDDAGFVDGVGAPTDDAGFVDGVGTPTEDGF